MHRILFFITASCFSAHLAAQGVTIGRLTGNIYGFRPAAPITLIDLAHPATSSGTLTMATVRWFTQSIPVCSGAFKILILRRAGVVPLDPDFTVVAERGPFDSSAGYITVPLSPPVAVQPNDLIAVSQLKAGCGGLAESLAGPGDSFLQIDREISGSGTLAGDHLGAQTLNVRASSDAEVTDAVIAAAGAVPGAFGSFFRTSLQLTNIDLSATIKGRIIFHPANTPASSNDVSINYSIPGGATVSYPDLVAAMGGSGLGSLDIITNNSAAPLAMARVFDDQGETTGTKGFTEAAISPGAALRNGERLSLTIPADLTHYRVNVGVRSLAAGAQFTVSTYNAEGSSIQISSTKTYVADYFEQVPLASFLETTPPPGGMAVINMAGGNAVIYFSTTDNRTNDSSIQFAQRP